MADLSGLNHCRPAIFLDRDGVINENLPHYVRSWDEIHILPGVLDALRTLRQTPFAVVVVTNQSAVNRGLLSLAVLHDIHERLQMTIAEAGGQLDAIYFCPHRPNEACSCRKPLPGLLIQAAAALNLDLARSYLVGDAITDLEAALAVGVQPLLVRTGRGAAHATLLDTQTHALCPVVDDLSQAIFWILTRHAQLTPGAPALTSDL